MGYWGLGVFENDYSLEIVYRIYNEVISLELNVPESWEDIAAVESAAYILLMFRREGLLRKSPEKSLISNIYKQIQTLHSKNAMQLSKDELNVVVGITEKIFDELLSNN